MKIHRDIIGNGVTGSRWQRKGSYLADCKIIEDQGVQKGWGIHWYRIEILDGPDKGKTLRVDGEQLINE